MHAAAGECIQIGGEGGDQRLAFPGAHLGDPALVEGDAAEQLDVEVAHVESAPAGLAHHRERFGEHRFERFPVTDPGAKGLRPRAKLVAGECGERRLQCVDALDGSAHPAQLPVIAGADDLAEQGLDHGACGCPCDVFAMGGVSI